MFVKPDLGIKPFPWIPSFGENIFCEAFWNPDWDFNYVHWTFSDYNEIVHTLVNLQPSKFKNISRYNIVQSYKLLCWSFSSPCIILIFCWGRFWARSAEPEGALELLLAQHSKLLPPYLTFHTNSDTLHFINSQAHTEISPENYYY